MRLDKIPAIHLLCSSNKEKGATCHHTCISIKAIYANKQVCDFSFSMQGRWRTIDMGNNLPRQPNKRKPWSQGWWENMFVEWSYTVVIYSHLPIGFKEGKIILVPGKGINGRPLLVLCPNCDKLLQDP